MSNQPTPPPPAKPLPAKPLQGQRVVITRASHQNQTLSVALTTAGAEVIEAPSIAIVPPTDGGQPLDDALLRLERFSWVAFTSVNAVAATFARADRRGVRKRFAQVKVAAVGPATAQRIERELERPPDLVPATDPATHTTTADPTASLASPAADGSPAAALAEAFATPTNEDHCLIPQAQQARPELAEGLRARGWQVTTVVAYRTVQPDLPQHLLADVTSADAVVFASPSAVTGHLAQLTKLRSQLNPTTAVVCIGGTTAAACEQAGITPAAIAQSPTPEHLVTAVASAVASQL